MLWRNLPEGLNQIAVVGERAALVVAVRAVCGEHHIAREATAPSLFGLHARAERLKVAAQVAHAHSQIAQLRFELLRQSLERLHRAAQLLQFLHGLLQLSQPLFLGRGRRRGGRFGRDSVDALLQLADALVNDAGSAGNRLRKLRTRKLPVGLELAVWEAFQNAQAHQLAYRLIRPVVRRYIAHLRVRTPCQKTKYQKQYSCSHRLLLE
jgi:hypothetical protein